jgi:ribosomal protein L37AE/L43A
MINNKENRDTFKNIELKNYIKSIELCDVENKMKCKECNNDLVYDENKKIIKCTKCVKMYNNLMDMDIIDINNKKTITNYNINCSECNNDLYNDPIYGYKLCTKCGKVYEELYDTNS